MIAKNCGGHAPALPDEPTDDDTALLAAARGLGDAMRPHADALRLDKALSEVEAVVRAANRYFDSMEPWKLKKSDPDRMGDVLAVSLETLRCIAIAYQPFMPDAAGRMLALLGVAEGPDRMLAALPAGWNYTAAVGVGLAGAIVLSKLAKQIVMVKQGTLCFAQFFENGATHVLQAGVQPLASFGTTTQTFEVKEDAMNFGTVTFARVKPGFVGLATDNGKLRLVDSALAPVPSHPPRRLASYAPGRAPSKL